MSVWLGDSPALTDIMLKLKLVVMVRVVDSNAMMIVMHGQQWLPLMATQRE